MNAFLLISVRLSRRIKVAEIIPMDASAEKIMIEGRHATLGGPPAMGNSAIIRLNKIVNFQDLKIK